jgi:hypothetical protein
VFFCAAQKVALGGDLGRLWDRKQSFRAGAFPSWSLGTMNSWRLAPIEGSEVGACVRGLCISPRFAGQKLHRCDGGAFVVQGEVAPSVDRAWLRIFGAISLGARQQEAELPGGCVTKPELGHEGKPELGHEGSLVTREVANAA